MRGNGRYVYGFDEPSEGGRELLGGKGVGLAEMTQLGVPVPSGFTITTDACRAYMANGQAAPGRAARGDRAAHRRARAADRQALRRPAGPAARLRALGRRGLDARDDGHDPQPRPERRRGRGARLEHRQPALRLRLVPPPDPDVRRGRRGRRRAPLRAGAHRPEGRARRPAGRRARRERPARARRHLQADLRGRDRRSPSRRTRATSSRERCAPSSSRGTRRGRRSTAARTGSPTTSAPR